MDHRNIHARGAAMLGRRQQAVAGVAIVYVRGAAHIPLTATPGKTDLDIDDGSGIVRHVESRDYLILAADLHIAGARFEPQRGDLIRERVGDAWWVYELLPLAGEPGWRYSDLLRTRIRVHTKRIRVEPT